MRAFVRLWAIACLFNLISHFDLQGGVLVLAGRAACLAIAGYVAVRPCGRGWSVLAATYLALSIADAPRVNNHGVLIAVVHVVGLIGALRVGGWRAGGWGADAERTWWRRMRPFLRGSLAILYFWAVVHKLNGGFLDPVWSCASSEWAKLTASRPFEIPLNWLPEGVGIQRLAIAATLVVETAIPLSLLFRGTRRFGIGLAVVFHGWLGMTYPAFSATLWALLAAFLPDVAAQRATRTEHDAANTIDRPLVFGAAAFATVLAVAAAALQTPEDSAVAWSLPLLRHLFLVYTVVLGVRIVAAWKDMDLSPGPGRGPAPEGAVAWLALACIGALPYLGVQATRSFAMYSNLEVSSGRSNHLVVPAAWQRVFDRRSPLVTIRGSSDPILAALARPGWSGAPDNRSFSTFGRPPVDAARRSPPRWRLPLRALRSRVAERAARGERTMLSYEIDGRAYHTLDAAEDPLLTSPRAWERRFVRPRAVPDGAEGLCMW